MQEVINICRRKGGEEEKKEEIVSILLYGILFFQYGMSLRRSYFFYQMKVKEAVMYFNICGKIVLDFLRDRIFRDNFVYI